MATVRAGTADGVGSTDNIEGSEEVSLANLQGEWARLLIGSFADAGVTDVVISPGSRSTPFVLAAASHAGLRCWDLIDERSAAFFALGRARITGRPALLLCTSGTAAANYLPAVVEAGQSHLPLLVLTADRPVELSDCGANQTIDQLKLFGDHARSFVDLGAPDPSPLALRALRRAVAQAVFDSGYPEPGVIHLNARARKPLEPRPALSSAERTLVSNVDELLAQSIARPSSPRRLPAERDIEELAELCGEHERGLIVCGPAPVAEVAARPLLTRLAALTGYPICCEPASQGRFWDRPDTNEASALAVDASDAILRSRHWRSEHRPEFILQVGGCPTSAAWRSYLDEQVGGEHWVLAPYGWNDHRSTATRLIFAEIVPVLDALCSRLAGSLQERAESRWKAEWQRAENEAWRVIDAELSQSGELSEGGVARSLVLSLPSGSLLALGNSLPVREVDTYGRGDGADVAICCQRGASGIDGVLSGAAGAASAWRRGPSALLIGDVSFLHDLGGLAAARQLSSPLAIVVVQNRGGRIFEQLPLAGEPSVQGEVFDHWLTPHDYDFEGAAALYRLPFERVDSESALEAALRRSLERPGASVIEAVVQPDGAAKQNRRVWRLLDAALSRP